jgi:uncharacterized protein (TIGR02678 family)
MKELELLLENYWIIKDDDKELYYRIKDAIPQFKSFLNDKLGYHVIVNPNVIKLEKLPGKAESWMGIEEFDSVMEYAFLCLLLMFLEDRGREEQFVLSQVTEYIQAGYPGDEKVDWTLYRHRRCLIKVMRFAADTGMVRVNDGDEQVFAADAATEVLYESSGLSRYFVRNFPVNILGFTSYKDIENEDLIELDRDRGTVRRHRVYRRVLMSPAVYNGGAEDQDYLYVKNFKSLIEKDMETWLGISFHVHRNGAMLVLEPTKSMGRCFPDNRAISDIVLQMNSLLLSDIREGRITSGTDDRFVLSWAAFASAAARLKEKCMGGWSKEFREMDVDLLTEQIFECMKAFSMAEKGNDGREIWILPLVGKITGSYPDDFAKGKEV